MAKYYQNQENKPLKLNWNPNVLFDFMTVNYVNHKDDIDYERLAQDGLTEEDLTEEVKKAYTKRPIFINLGGTRCFSADTEIVCNKGVIPISDLKMGDLVMSYNHKNKDVQYKKVLEVVKNNHNTKKCLRFNFKNRHSFSCTDDHEIYFSGSYIKASLLKKCFDSHKDVCYISDEETFLKIDKIKNIKEVELSETYDLRVEDNANYYVNAGFPVLVHNSGKTYEAFDFIVAWCDDNRMQNLSIDIYRETLVKARGTTLEDCLKCFDFIGLRRNVDYTLTGEINSTPTIKLWGNTIQFKGLPDKGSEAGAADVVYINEVFEIMNKDIVMGIYQRCKKCMVMDANPSLTQHWSMEMQNEFNVFYTWTNYMDNKHLPDGLTATVESWCEWDFKDSVVETDSWGFKKRRWLKPACKEGEVYDPEIHRKKNELNHKRGTVDSWRYLVYGEGIPAPQSGAIFKEVQWIKEFPETGLEHVHFGLDYGFSNDESVLSRVGVSGKDLYAEAMTYQKTPTPEILYDLIEPLLENEIQRRKKEAGDGEIGDIIIVCDSQDRYKDQQFTTDLQNIAIVKGKIYQFVKCKKPQIVTRVGLVRRFNIHLVENPHVRVEQQNYIYMKHPDGSPMNIPDPASKYCHFWDSMGYCVWYFFRYYLNVEK